MMGGDGLAFDLALVPGAAMVEAGAALLGAAGVPGAGVAGAVLVGAAGVPAAGVAGAVLVGAAGVPAAGPAMIGIGVAGAGTGVALLGTGVAGAGASAALLGTGAGTPVAVAGTTASLQPLEHLQLLGQELLGHLQLVGHVPLAMVEDAHGCLQVELQTQQSGLTLCQYAVGLSSP